MSSIVKFPPLARVNVAGISRKERDSLAAQFEDLLEQRCGGKRAKRITVNVEAELKDEGGRDA